MNYERSDHVSNSINSLFEEGKGDDYINYSFSVRFNNKILEVVIPSGKISLNKNIFRFHFVSLEMITETDATFANLNNDKT